MTSSDSSKCYDQLNGNPFEESNSGVARIRPVKPTPSNLLFLLPPNGGIKVILIDSVIDRAT